MPRELSAWLFSAGQTIKQLSVSVYSICNNIAVYSFTTAKPFVWSVYSIGLRSECSFVRVNN